MRLEKRAVWRVCLALAVLGMGLCCGFFRQPAAPASAAFPGGEGVRLPVVMYHHLLKDPARSNSYTITPDEFEKDLQTIAALGMTPMTFEEVLGCLETGATFPPRPIVLTFDDGYESNYVYAFPLLQKYGMKAVVSILGYYSDVFSQEELKSVAYSHITWTEIAEMRASGLVEFGNHTYLMHRDGPNSKSTRQGVLRAHGESEETYTRLITMDIQKTQDALSVHTGRTPLVFAYPFGFYSQLSEKIIKDMGFRVTLTAEKGENILRSPDDLFLLKRHIRPHGINSRAFFESLCKAES